MEGWRDMSAAALDAAYANAPHIPDGATYPARWAAAAAAFRATARADLDIVCPGGGSLDLFHPDGTATGLTVFVHGGYWRAFGRSDFSHLAAAPLARGQVVAMVGYPLAPGARIASITRAVSVAVDIAADRIPGPVRLAGHSAGGHLVARLAMPDAAPECIERIARCLPISPVSDLRPLVPQALNEVLRLDAAGAEAESPAVGRPLGHVPIAIHVGAEERPAFLWQAERLATAWSADLTVLPGRHHFDIIDGLTDPGSPMVADLLS